jgi:hypothetical protein
MKEIIVLNKQYFNFLDNDEIYNNPNFHPEEQEEFEIPDGNY